MASQSISEGELLEKHVSYELEMLAHTFLFMQKNNWNFEYPVGNSLIEAFSVHARNLVYFFESSHGSDVTVYVDASYQPPSINANLMKKLHQQIAHLTLKRTSNTQEKLHAEAQRQLLVELLVAFEDFQRHLLPAYTSLWHPTDIPASTDPRFASPVFSVGGPNTATNSIVMSSTNPGKAP